MINLTAASFAFLEIAIGWVIAGFILILELLILWFIWIGTTKNYWQYDRVNKRWVWNPRGIDLEFLLSDEKGYASFSRFQFLIFTFVIALSIVLITFSAKDVNCLKNNPNNQQNCPNIPAFPNIPLEIIALLGVSGGSYVIAKSIDSSQNGISVPPAEPPTPPKIIKNDTGRVADEFSKGKTNTLLFDLHLLESQVTDNLTEVANATPVDMREEFEKSIKETHRDLTFEQIFNKRNSIRTHQMLQQMLGSEILGERAFTEESNIISIPAQTSAGFGFFL